MTAQEHFDRIGHCGDYPAQPVCTATVEQIQEILDDGMRQEIKEIAEFLRTYFDPKTPPISPGPTRDTKAHG